MIKNKHKTSHSNESLQSPVQRGLRHPIKSGSQVLFVGCCCVFFYFTFHLSCQLQIANRESFCSKQLNKLLLLQTIPTRSSWASSGLLLPSVCRGKARRPYLPCRCPLPQLNQLSSFSSFVRVSKQAACFSFSAPAAKQPAPLASPCKGSQAFIPKCGASPSQQLWAAAAPCLHRAAGRSSFGGNLAWKRCRVSNRIFQELVELQVEEELNAGILFEMLKTSGLD